MTGTDCFSLDFFVCLYCIEPKSAWSNERQRRQMKREKTPVENFEFQIPNKSYFFHRRRWIIYSRARESKSDKKPTSKLLVDCVADSFKKLSNLFTVNLFMAICAVFVCAQSLLVTCSFSHLLAFSSFTSSCSPFWIAFRNLYFLSFLPFSERIQILLLFFI